MGDITKIEWADRTLNWWIGCNKVAAGCDHCYAESMVKRFGHDFSERRLTSYKYRSKAFSWDANHVQFFRDNGHRQRVFVNSMADVFDNKAPDSWRNMLWRLIRFTPHLDYLLLTKRIGNANKMLPADFSAETYPNVWLGISACIQEDLDRDLQKLLMIDSACHFISAEPMIEPLSFPDRTWMENSWRGIKGYVDWVICGGESGAKARPLPMQAVRNLSAMCRARGVRFFMKQGSQTPAWGNRHGFKDFAAYPPDIQTRDWPSTLASIDYYEAFTNGEFKEDPQPLNHDQKIVMKSLITA